jgi:hypothetical protein
MKNRSLSRFTFALLVLPVLSFAVGQMERVYPISTVKTLEPEVTAYTTAKGLSVYIDCNRLTFDNPTNDWVDGFSNKNAWYRTIHSQCFVLNPVDVS